MLNFSFIGLGQVGGLFSNHAKKVGYPSLAVNTASIDLKSLDALDNEEKIHLIGYEGAGKDRNVGYEAFVDHIDMLSDAFQAKLSDSHVIFVALALGGGSGSGMAPALINYLLETFPNKVISPILYLPHDNENTKSIMNAIECFSEISDIKETGATFIFDNKKINELNQSLRLKEKYSSTRAEFLNLLDTFNNHTGKHSDLANLDKMDLLTTLSERGAALISEMGVGEDDVLNPSKMGERLMRTWEFSPFSNTDLTHISKGAFLTTISSDLTTNFTIEEMFVKLGKPLELFSGLYTSKERSVMYSLVTGLSYPMRKLKKLEEQVKSNEKLTSKTIENARNQKFSTKKWSDSLKQTRKIKI